MVRELFGAAYKSRLPEHSALEKDEVYLEGQLENALIQTRSYQILRIKQRILVFVFLKVTGSKGKV